MLKIAVIGLEKNNTSEFYKSLESLKSDYKVEFVPFIYSHKDNNLYNKLWEKKLKPNDFSAAISVGGDGTFLYVSRIFAGSDVPVFGVNKGHTGFNTNFEENEFEEYFRLFMNNKVDYDYKRLLTIELDGNKEKFDVVNEGVISYSGITRMISLRVELEGISLCNFRGDGLIISSPTGSTAYNLSAGGPILHPSVNAFVLTPICPHTLAIRPYIIPFDKIITIIVEESSIEAQITLDGQKILNLHNGQKVRFKKSDKCIKIIRGKRYFSEVLEKKLGWKVKI